MSSGDASGGRHKPYHHGALHAALIDASIALAREGGPDRVVVREAARAADVSHSAAYRHFADRDALLAEVSEHARRELGDEMRTRVKRARGPRQRLRAVGTAYIEFALREPGLFRTAFISHPATSPPDSNTRGAAADDPFGILGHVLDQATAAGLIDSEVRPGAEIAAWSAVHGLANLLLDGPLPTTKAEVDFSVTRVLDLVEHGLFNGC